MKIAAWNVNSIRARLDRVLAWLGEAQPDVLCLQETKVDDSAFPYAAVEAAGYQVLHNGQKTYNGVAILSRTAIADPLLGLDDGDAEDTQSRLVAGTVSGVRVLSCYVPNGQALDSPKFDYKLRWLSRLRRHLEAHYRPDAALVLCGDFNVAPEPRDVHDPDAWANSVLFHERVRAALADVTTGFGLVDTFRLHCADEGRYSWWDYRSLSFPRNDGLRIDHVFATRPLADRCTAASIDRDQRKGKQPSDHAPVLATFEV